mmetsp:Transcript_109522/g.275504  ORF Transcript_109522/g.275504 Transcript_109522/m.275504 type:complete len:238 (-) Transcript_109522:50-763(-)
METGSLRRCCAIRLPFPPGLLLCPALLELLLPAVLPHLRTTQMAEVASQAVLATFGVQKGARPAATSGMVARAHARQFIRSQRRPRGRGRRGRRSAQVQCEAIQEGARHLADDRPASIKAKVINLVQQRLRLEAQARQLGWHHSRPQRIHQAQHGPRGTAFFLGWQWCPTRRCQNVQGSVRSPTLQLWRHKCLAGHCEAREQLARWLVGVSVERLISQRRLDMAWRPDAKRGGQRRH